MLRASPEPEDETALREMVKIKRRHGRLKWAAGKPNGDASGKLDTFCHRRCGSQWSEGSPVHLWHLKSRKTTFLILLDGLGETRTPIVEKACPIVSFHNLLPHSRIRLL